MLVCQTGYVDQPGCKVRVEHHGLGYSLDIKTATSSQIGKQLASLLTDDIAKNRVDSMHKVFQKYENDRIAERLIESYLDH
jgi:UDP:flavonoid glycosyltransferase YjiC (YdhE family)